MDLVWAQTSLLPGYIDALRRGWSPNTVRPEASAEELHAIAVDPEAFLRSLVDREAAGPPIVLPDGTAAARIPGFRKWIWDGEFAGSIGLRWQTGTSELPDHVLGHIGYSVVPWKRGRGYATNALGLILVDARREGLTHVDLTTDIDNVASRRVIEANRGELLDAFSKPDAYGGQTGVRYRIHLV